MIAIHRELAALRAQVGDWKRAGLRVGFVPTMGNLHAGHHSLVALARRHADRVVASVFVNPTQFGPNEDFSRYPRTPGQDAEGLQAAGCDALWLPSVETMYPYGPERCVRMHVPGVTDTLEGAHRPGHFDGVATVVARLFNQVQADVAAFGRKDYQQLAVIRALVQDLNMPIQIIGAPTQRAEDGLALSSRNGYLSDEQRATAPALYRGLQTIAEELRRGARDYARLIETTQAQQRTAGFIPDYLEIRNAVNLRPAQVDDHHLVILTAAQLGSTRLIDNLVVELPRQ